MCTRPKTEVVHERRRERLCSLRVKKRACTGMLNAKLDRSQLILLAAFHRAEACKAHRRRNGSNDQIGEKETCRDSVLAASEFRGPNSP